MSTLPKSWAERIRDLKDTGMTLADIADEVAAPISTIGSLANGDNKSPRGDLALRLFSLYESKCGLKKASRKAG